MTDDNQTYIKKQSETNLSENPSLTRTRNHSGIYIYTHKLARGPLVRTGLDLSLPSLPPPPNLVIQTAAAPARAPPPQQPGQAPVAAFPDAVVCGRPPTGTGDFTAAPLLSPLSVPWATRRQSLWNWKMYFLSSSSAARKEELTDGTFILSRSAT